MPAMRPSPRIPSVLLSVILITLGASAAVAAPLTCQRVIARETTAFLQAQAKTAANCRGRVVRGKPPCDGGVSAARLETAKKRLGSAIGKACGGDTTGEDTPAALGWPASCPGLVGGVASDCNAAMTSWADVTRCLECVGERAVQQATDLYYDDLAIPGATRALVKCQAAIGAEATRFLVAQAKSLSTCWVARLKGKHGNACPDPGDGKAAQAILAAQAKQRAAICKACGGADGLCGGGDDFSVATIGFAASCDIVTVPAGPSCARSITDLASLVDCVGCVTRFAGNCADRVQVPQFGEYPTECEGPTPTPTAMPTPSVTPSPSPCGNGVLESGEDCEPTGLDAACPGQCAPMGLADECTCPTGTFTLTAIAGADVDVGWTGIAHDQDPITEKLLDALTYGCSSGGSDRRCSYVAEFFSAPFVGPPVPISTGSVPVCVVRESLGRPDGVLDLSTGEFTQKLASIFHVYSGTSVALPCPICIGDPGDADGVKGGTCNDGPSSGSPCDAEGITNFFGKTSVDCLPSTGSTIGDLIFVAKQGTTGTKTISASAMSPKCSGGDAGERCFCDTCDNLAATPCRADADCLDVGATRCGGKRCLGGSNAGAPCAQSSECAGAVCGRPGEPTKRNACIGGICTPNPRDPNNPNEGLCEEGPVDQTCSLESFRGCNGDAACNPPPVGDCQDCRPNQTCAARLRECFLDPIVTRTGTPGIPSGVFAADFCLGPTGASAVNSVIGLPGLGTYLIPYTLALSIP